MAKTVPQQLADALPAPRNAASDIRPEARQGAAGHLIWLIVPLVCATVGWSLVGDQLTAKETQQIVEVAGITFTGAIGLWLASYVRSRNVRVERTYSAHLEELSERLRRLAYKDSLTDLYNHRYFHEQLGHEVERANRYGRPVSVILMDLDHFKEVNDTHGHLMGDKLLTFIGQVINTHVRGADIAARYGGDEFAFLLPDTPQEAAEATASKLARAIATGRSYAGSLGERLPLSTSYGVACCPDEARTVSELLQLADDRLYAAKDARLPRHRRRPLRLVSTAEASGGDEGDPANAGASRPVVRWMA